MVTMPYLHHPLLASSIYIHLVQAMTMVSKAYSPSSMLASSVYIHLMQAMDDGNYGILPLPLLVLYIHLMQAMDDGKYAIVTSSIACTKCIYKTSNGASMAMVTIIILHFHYMFYI